VIAPYLDDRFVIVTIDRWDLLAIGGAPRRRTTRAEEGRQVPLADGHADSLM
jgi:hypothetical protein